jgi:type II secretion system protein N
MNSFRKLFYLIIILPVFVILTWFFAIPDSYVKASIEDAILIHTDSNIDTSLSNFRKGLFFTAYADSLDLRISNIHALRVTGVKSKINPFSIVKKQIAFTVEGKIGTGDIKGYFTLPGDGTLTISRAELNAIPYLKTLGLEGKGYLSGDIILKDDSVDATFHIPNADIQGTLMGTPLPVNSFHKIQGALSIRGDTIDIKSVSLELDKGYARLKGKITNGYMNLALEIMPTPGKLENYESMLLAQFMISPGYYIVPIKGSLL